MSPRKSFLLAMLFALCVPILVGLFDKRWEMRLRLDPLVPVPFSEADEAELRTLLAGATLREDTTVSLDGCMVVRRTVPPDACEGGDESAWRRRETTIDLTTLDPVRFAATGTAPNTADGATRRLGLSLPMTEEATDAFRQKQRTAESAQRHARSSEKGTSDAIRAATKMIGAMLGDEAWRNATLFTRCNGDLDVRYLDGDRRLVMRQGDPKRLVDLLARYAKRFCPAD